jgi:hypothetical protein
MQENTKHTPGPWEVQTHIGNDKIHRVMPLFLRANTGVLPVWVGGGFYLKNEADAHLIAAAPEMLTALKKALDNLRHVCTELGAEHCSRCAVAIAIAKAECRS